MPKVALLKNWTQPLLQRQCWGADQWEVTQTIEEWAKEDVVEVFESQVLLPRPDGTHEINRRRWGQTDVYYGKFLRTQIAVHRDGRMGIRPSVVGNWEECLVPVPYGMH